VPSSGLTQLREQSVLIRAPAAIPMGSKPSNSLFMGVGGTTAFQMPSSRGTPLSEEPGSCAFAYMQVQNDTAARTVKRLNAHIAQLCLGLT
jgi:hypothetical protein